MSAFLWLSPKCSDEAGERALSMFRRQVGALILEYSGPGRVYLAASVEATGHENWVYSDQEGFTAITGTPFGKSCARPAEMLHKGILSADDLLGGYCILSGTRHDLTLQTDPVGQQFIYCSEDNSIVSTCFLATVAGIGTAKLNVQALYEYVFFGSIYGGETLVNEVRLLMAGERLQVQNAGVSCSVPDAIKPLPFDGSFEDAVEITADRFIYSMESVSSSFGGIDTALSGGFDTRLILAGLRAVGASNYSLHVYGKSDSHDVTLAKAICAGEALPLEHRDKSVSVKNSEDNWPQLLERNMLMFDGIPTDSIVDNGNDLATRLERSRGGRTSLNGGCGEILRNFFYLPDRSLSVSQLLDAFYRRYDLNTLPEQFSESDFRQQFGLKILSAIGREGNLATRLTREDVERVYPLFRGRYWTSRNTSINLRLGRAALPFLTPGLIAIASGLPLRFKSYGKLEAAVIEKLDPALAAYPSDYGFDFKAGPSMKYKLKSQPSIRRPFWLRRASYTLQHRRAQAARTTDQMPPELARLEAMRRYFKVENIKDDIQLKRLLTVEYLIKRQAIRIE